MTGSEIEHNIAMVELCIMALLVGTPEKWARYTCSFLTGSLLYFVAANHWVIR